MFKVLPQMHRLVEQILEEYGLQIAETVVDSENVGVPATHYPYYIVMLWPNDRGWLLISCRPHKGRHVDFSASQNNVTVVATAIDAGGEERRFVLPSWRGKLVPEGELDKHTYHIKRGYMLTTVEPDFIEEKFIGGFKQS